MVNKYSTDEKFTRQTKIFKSIVATKKYKKVSSFPFIDRSSNLLFTSFSGGINKDENIHKSKTQHIKHALTIQDVIIKACTIMANRARNHN